MTQLFKQESREWAEGEITEQTLTSAIFEERPLFAFGFVRSAITAGFSCTL